MNDQSEAAPQARSGARVPEDFAAGLFLVLVSAFFIWKAWNLPLGTLRAMGPGMLPTSIAVIMGVGGFFLAVIALVKGGNVMTMPHVRGLFFVLGGIVLFGLTIRSMGLIVAGPLSMIFASFATEEVRPVEAAIFAVCMTAFCIALFKFGLGLPIPVIAFI